MDLLLAAQEEHAAAAPPPPAERALVAFLRQACAACAGAPHLRHLAAACAGRPAADRGAVTEQVLAREYALLWAECCLSAPLAGGFDAAAPYMDAAAWNAHSKALCGPDDDDPRGDPTLLLLTEALCHYCGGPGSLPAANQRRLEGLWAELQDAEERSFDAAQLDDAALAARAAREETLARLADEYYAELSATVPKLPPQEQRAQIQAIQQAGLAALVAANPDFAALSPDQRQAVVDSLEPEARRPVVRMHQMQRIQLESQRLQSTMQNLAQQYMRIIPTLSPPQIDQQHARLKAKALAVLPDGFDGMSPRAKQEAIMDVPFEHRVVVMRWNAFVQVLTMMQNAQRQAMQKPDSCCRPDGG